MIIGKKSAEIITELNKDLSQKTLEFISERFNQRFPHTVPWMSLMCLTDFEIKDPSIFFDIYKRGCLLSDPQDLQRIASFLKTEGKPIIDRTLSPRTGIIYTHDISIIEDLGEKKEAWVSCFDKAKALLLESDALFPEIFYELVHFVVYVKVPQKFAFSTHLARGAVFFTPPVEKHPEITMAIDLVHELGHQVLMIYQSADTLIASSLEQPVWSAVRQTYRPAIQSMQAAAALTYMLILVKNLLGKQNINDSEREYISQAFEAMKTGLSSTLFSLREHCQFTEVGQQIMQDFEQVL